jgi:hypothetical protein
MTAIDRCGFYVIEVSSEVDHNGRPCSILIGEHS